MHKLIRIFIAFSFLASFNVSVVSKSTALTLVATGSDASPCDQTLDSITGVSAQRLVDGDCVIEFTNTSSYVWTVPRGLQSVTYLVVGGGGGGGNGYDAAGGGGGGGGMVLTGELTVTPQENVSISVGAGGAGGADARTNNAGSTGSSSIFSSITALGGGAGAGSRTGGNPGAAQVGNVSAPTGGFGNGGGDSGDGGGGAGGAGTAGDDDGTGTTAVAGVGGAGVSSSITGSSITFGAGGNGGASGDLTNLTVDGSNGTANRGIGGGGGKSKSSDSAAGGRGGSGIVILRFTPVFIPSAPTLNTVSGGDRSITVNFTANSNGGAAITDYEYSLNGGSYISAGTTTSPFTILGLNGRTSYSVTIKAKNSVGLSSASSSLDVTTTDASLDASEAAERQRVADEQAASAKRAKEQKELTELLSLIPSIAELALNIGKVTKSAYQTKCVKNKSIRFVNKGKLCPKGFVKSR